MVNYKTYKIRRKLLLPELVKPWLNYCYYDEHLRKLTLFKEYSHCTTKKKYYKNVYYQLGIDKITYDSVIQHKT